MLQDCDNLLLVNSSPALHRYAYPGEPAARHSTHAGKCAFAVLLRLLHLRDHRGAAVGGAPEKPLLP